MNKRTYCLMYHPRVSVDNITPVLNLSSLLEIVNRSVNTDRKMHTPGEQDNLARMVRLNWMVENLKHEPVYKPIVTVLRDGKLVTITGDTRLQAIELIPHINEVSCLASIPIDMQENFKYWDPVLDIDGLARLMNISKKNIVLNTDFDVAELDWIEFDMVETSNHMHDEDQRLRMIYNYLDQQPKNFQFTREWIQTPIEWTDYSV